ncbi:MAG: DUF1801 domain-containing protein [Planctomycetota bacterium]
MGVKTVDEYFGAARPWRQELFKLREVLCTTGLEETVKWGAPCYVHEGTNVVGIGAFKAYVGLWFFQGALLSDAEGVLINAQAGKTKAMRQWRFTDSKDIRTRPIKAYVEEAIALVAAGEQIKPERGKRIEIPSELAVALGGDARAREAFDKLSLGKRREYTEHVASAKREATRASRAEKALPLIRAGRGLHDKYRS